MKGFFKHLRGDLFGGLTAGVVALPLALAFGVQSGLGAVAGLYGAILIGFIASLFGGTPTQISGPTAPMTAVSMTVIAGIVAVYNGDIETALPAILAVFIMAGLLQIGLGALKLGKYIKYIPYPVVSGFMTGIGVIILITQLLPAVGYYPNEDEQFLDRMIPQATESVLNKNLEDQRQDDGLLTLESYQITANQSSKITSEEIKKEARVIAKKKSSGVIGTLKTIPTAINNINITELAIALITIFIIFGFKKITTAVPSTLVALLSVSAVAYFLKLDVRTIGEIPSSIPMPRLDIFTSIDFGIITPYIFTALTLAFLGAIDSLLTSVVADNMTKTRHDPNKELVGQGIGNSVAALFGGIPGAGATIRTVVNINSGGKTKLSGMIAAVLLFIIVIALAGFAENIPSAVLAGILITVGIGVMDYKGLKALKSIPRGDVFVMFVVLILTVFWDLVYAVGVGLVIASLIFMKKMGDLNTENSSVKSFDDDTDELAAEYGNLPKSILNKIVVKELKGPLFFGSTRDFQAMSNQVVGERTHAVIRMGEVPFMDQSGLFAFEEVLLTLRDKGMKPILVGVQEQPLYRFETIDIIPDIVQKEHVFQHMDDALEFLKKDIDHKKVMA
ncbi:MAG: SulP family inorganic anion transporter [Nonlabens sp.]